MWKRDDQVLFFFFLDPAVEALFLEDAGGVFERWGTVSVKLSLCWENDLDPPSTTLGLRRTRYGGARRLLEREDRVNGFFFDALARG